MIHNAISVFYNFTILQFYNIENRDKIRSERITEIQTDMKSCINFKTGSSLKCRNALICDLTSLTNFYEALDTLSF